MLSYVYWSTLNENKHLKLFTNIYIYLIINFFTSIMIFTKECVQQINKTLFQLIN